MFRDLTEEWKDGTAADTDVLAKGPVPYLRNEDNVALDKIFTFIKEYVKYIYNVGEIKKWLYRNKGKSMLDFITPSDVAYCISLIENSSDLWDQDMQVKAASPDEQLKYKGIGLANEEEREKYAKKVPKFTKGEKTKRTFGAVMWNQEGEEYYTKVKGVWEHVFRDKIVMDAFGSKWTEWVKSKGGYCRHWSNKVTVDPMATVLCGSDDDGGGSENEEVGNNIDGNDISFTDDEDDGENGGVGDAGRGGGGMVSGDGGGGSNAGADDNDDCDDGKGRDDGADVSGGDGEEPSVVSEQSGMKRKREGEKNLLLL